MRYAVISDIHGNLAALEAVVRDFQRRGVDQVLNLGDHLSGPLLPRETADVLMSRDWVHLAGNHERQLLEASERTLSPSDAHAHAVLEPSHFAWMASLVPTQRFGEDLVLCHGTPRSDREHLLATITEEGFASAEPAAVEGRLQGWNASVVLCGHSHVPWCLQLPDGPMVLNPGSVGLQAYRDSDPWPYHVETGSPEARYAILKKEQGAWKAELVQVSYDVESMAELARIRGFKLWEEALRSGRLPASNHSGDGS